MTDTENFKVVCEFKIARKSEIIPALEAAVSVIKRYDGEPANVRVQKAIQFEVDKKLPPYRLRDYEFPVIRVQYDSVSGKLYFRATRRACQSDIGVRSIDSFSFFPLVTTYNNEIQAALTIEKLEAALERERRSLDQLIAAVATAGEYVARVNELTRQVFELEYSNFYLAEAFPINNSGRIYS